MVIHPIHISFDGSREPPLNMLIYEDRGEEEEEENEERMEESIVS
jgi:hypothetical protein